MLLIPVIGKNEYLGVKHKELCAFIVSYGIFINKIKHHPKNLYEIDEDTIGIIN